MTQLVAEITGSVERLKPPIPRRNRFAPGPAGRGGIARRPSKVRFVRPPVSADNVGNSEGIAAHRANIARTS